MKKAGAGGNIGRPAVRKPRSQPAAATRASSAARAPAGGELHFVKSIDASRSPVVILTCCRLTGWTERNSASEFTTADGDIFEVTSRRKSVTCKACLSNLGMAS